MLAFDLENALGTTSLVGGALCGEEKGSFVCKSNEKLISRETWQLWKFQIQKGILSHTRNCQEQLRFHVSGLSSLFPLMKSLWKYSMYVSLQPNSHKIS